MTSTVVQHSGPINFIASWKKQPFKGQEWKELFRAVAIATESRQALLLIENIKSEWQSQGFEWTKEHSWLFSFGYVPVTDFYLTTFTLAFEIQICCEGQPTDKAVRFTVTCPK